MKINILLNIAIILIIAAVFYFLLHLLFTKPLPEQTPTIETPATQNNDIPQKYKDMNYNGPEK